MATKGKAKRTKVTPEPIRCSSCAKLKAHGARFTLPKGKRGDTWSQFAHSGPDGEWHYYFWPVTPYQPDEAATVKPCELTDMSAIVGDPLVIHYVLKPHEPVIKTGNKIHQATAEARRVKEETALERNRGAIKVGKAAFGQRTIMPRSRPSPLAED